MPNSQKWLQVSAESDFKNEQKLNTSPRCITLCELKPDSYMCLVLVDMTQEILPNTTLKVFRGAKLEHEYPLSGVPCAIESLYTDYAENRCAVIATAMGSDILFFRNLKPYFKYTLPVLIVEDLEQEIWRKLPFVIDQKQPELIEELRTLDLAILTNKSQHLLQIQDELQRKEFIRQHADDVVERRRNIVAMCKLQRVSKNEKVPPSHLVLAIDNGDLFVLEAESFAVIYKARMCAYETAPSLLSVHGTYETNFYIVIASRFGSIYLLRKSADESQEIIQLSQTASDILILPVDQTIMVSCMSKRIMCYSKKGKQLFCKILPSRPLCMIPIGLMCLGITLTCVALEGGKVQFYLQRQLVDEFDVSESVISMCFGYLGYQEDVLALVTNRGNVIIKILKRRANFDTFNKKVIINCEEQFKTLAVLNKTKKNSIFIEQANWEKQSAKCIVSF